MGCAHSGLCGCGWLVGLITNRGAASADIQFSLQTKIEKSRRMASELNILCISGLQNIGRFYFLARRIGAGSKFARLLFESLFFQSPTTN